MTHYVFDTSTSDILFVGSWLDCVYYIQSDFNGLYYDFREFGL